MALESISATLTTPLKENVRMREKVLENIYINFNDNNNNNAQSFFPLQ